MPKIRDNVTGKIFEVPDSELGNYGLSLPQAQPTQQVAQPQPSLSENVGKTLINFLSGMAKPFASTAQNIAGAAIEAPAAVASNVMAQAGAQQQLPQQLRDLLMGGSKALQKVNIIGDEKRQQIAQDPAKFVTQQAKDSANVASYGVPFGKGANVVTKFIAPGAVVGGLTGASRDTITLESLAGDIALGGVTAGVLGKGSELLSKAIGKTGGAVEKAGEAIRGSTRRITVKPSIYGAQKEEAINKTLNELGITGTAQQQYERLLPKMQDLGTQIDSILATQAKNVPVTTVKQDFLKNLQNAILSKDLTQKQAKQEVDGFLKSLYESMGNELGDTANTRDLFSLKQKVNELYQGVANKLENNTPLNPREKVISVARQTLDDVIAQAHPDVKNLTKQQSNLYAAAESLSRSRFNPPTLRIAGSSIPSDVTQRGADVVGRALQAVGGKTGNIAAIQAPSTLTNQAAIRTILEMGKNPQQTDTQTYDNSVQQQPAGNLNQIAPPQESVSQDTTGLPQITPEVLQIARLTLDSGEYQKIKDIYELQNPKSGKAPTEAEVARQQTSALIDDALSQLESNPNIKTGMVSGPLEDIKSKVGMGDQDTLDFNVAVSNLAATIAKQRGGTSFTPNEQRMLERYTPKVGDSKQQLMTKLRALKKLQLDTQR